MFEEITDKMVLEVWKALQKYREARGNFLYDLTGKSLEPVEKMFKQCVPNPMLGDQIQLAASLQKYKG